MGLIEYTKNFSNKFNKLSKNKFLTQLGGGDIRRGRFEVNNPYFNPRLVTHRSINKRAFELKDLASLGEKITDKDRIHTFKYVSKAFPNISDYKRK